MVVMQKDSRDENLQILRFVAAALVLITHVTFYIHERLNLNMDIWHGGEAGVPIFFVISGFVMYLSGLKISRDVDGAKVFLRRRVARIFPLYWLITTLKLVVAVVAPAAILHNHPDLLKVIASYLLIPMLNDVGQVRPLHGVAWTLLHEMYFYYVFSLSLLLRQSPFLCTSLIIVGVWIVGLFFPAESAFTSVCFSNINLMFVAGMLLAYKYKGGFRLSQSVALLVLVVGIAFVVSTDIGLLRRNLLGDFAIESILIVGAMLSIQITVLPRVKILLAKLGDSSYSLYMVHPIAAPAFCLILAKISIESAFVILPVTVFACVVISHLVYLYFEKPLNAKASKLLERVFH